MYLPRSVGDTRMLPGCMSAWKKPSRNTWVKKISTPARASAGISTPFCLQHGDLRYRRAVHALHHHDAPRAVVPVDRRHREQRRVREIAPQQRGVRRLAHQVRLVVQVARELGHHLARLEAPPVRPESLDQPRGGLEQQHVLRDRLLDAGPQHLHGDFGAVLERAQVHLRDRGAGDGLILEIGEYLLDALAQRTVRFPRRPGRKQRAAPGPAAWPVRRRCRRAAGRAAWTASGRT